MGAVERQIAVEMVQEGEHRYWLGGQVVARHHRLDTVLDYHHQYWTLEVVVAVVAEMEPRRFLQGEAQTLGHQNLPEGCHLVHSYLGYEIQGQEVAVEEPDHQEHQISVAVEEDTVMGHHFGPDKAAAERELLEMHQVVLTHAEDIPDRVVGIHQAPQAVVDRPGVVLHIDTVAYFKNMTKMKSRNK